MMNSAYRSDSIRETRTCEVCGRAALREVLDLGRQPLCDDLIPIGRSEQCTLYPVTIIYCEGCKTAHQKFQVAKEVLFPRTYHYRSRLTKDVLEGMRQLVASCERSLGDLTGKVVVDIGCNDGSLLGFFHKRGCVAVGVEPTGAVSDAPEFVHAYNTYFDEATALSIVSNHGQPALITLTNVFAHIEDLPALLRNLSRLMSDETVLVIENHYLGSVIQANQFDTFYQEHPRTYSGESFRHIAKTLGARIEKLEFPGRYGGNIRVFISRAAEIKECAEVDHLLEEREATFSAGLDNLRAFYQDWRMRARQKLAALVKTSGPLFGKAFPGRASIIINSLGLDHNDVAMVFEKPGSPKIGHYIPGTRIRIASDDDLFQFVVSDGSLINLAWHINDEIASYLRGLGFKGSLIKLLPDVEIVQVLGAP